MWRHSNHSPITNLNHPLSSFRAFQDFQLLTSPFILFLISQVYYNPQRFLKQTISSLNNHWFFWRYAISIILSHILEENYVIRKIVLMVCHYFFLKIILNIILNKMVIHQKKILNSCMGYFLYNNAFVSNLIFQK